MICAICSDNAGTQEFECLCNEGFDGKRCEHKCPLECKADEICISNIDSSNIYENAYQNWECIFRPCEANPCCEDGPNPLCCQNGVCSNDNFVFNPTTNNADECQCLCTDNFSGLFKYSHHIKWFQ